MRIKMAQVSAVSIYTNIYENPKDVIKETFQADLPLIIVYDLHKSYANKYWTKSVSVFLHFIPMYKNMNVSMK